MSGKYVCDIGQCRQPLTQLRNLKRHMTIPHPGQPRKVRPLLGCDIGGCPYLTRSPSEMELHTRRHRGERLLPCDACPYRAFTKSELTVHQRTYSDENVCMRLRGVRVCVLAVWSFEQTEEDAPARASFVTSYSRSGAARSTAKQPSTQKLGSA